jgi:gliding motility-associated-like protein
MKLSHLLWTISLLFFAHLSIAQQCPPGGAAFINEFSGNTIEEYIELVVVGDPSDPLAPVDLEGWIVDDNNIAQTGQGTASGHLILGSFFSAMAPGSIIVIYNPDAPASGIDPGLPNASGAYVLPHSDPNITICTSNPNTSDDSYIPCGSSGYQTWPLCIGLATGGDGAQVRTPSADFYHGLYYNTNFGPAGETGCLDVGNIESSLDCGDWYDAGNYSSLPPTPGEANTVLNQALIDAITLGILDCADISASCILFTCPEITAVEMIDGICTDEVFEVNATGLVNFGIAENTETDFGVEFILFNGSTPPADPYSGGTSLGVVDYSSLSGVSPNQTASLNTTINTAGSYQICAILNPLPTDPDCRPYACETIEIYENPTASLSGLHEFCPGDCHKISVLINGGNEPYDAEFSLSIGPITFPFNIPAYDVDDQLQLCFDAPGVLPNYDAGSNTLHIPTFISGSGSITLENITDDNNCSPASISPDFTTLVFYDQAEIQAAGPLELCDEDLDGLGIFDLTLLNDILNGASGATVLWFEDGAGTLPIANPGAYVSGTGTVYAQIDDSDCPSEILGVDLILTTIAYPGEDTDVDICNEGNTVLDLLSEIGGEPGGIWFDESSSGVDLNDPSNVDFEGLIAGTYLFSYTFLALGVCPETVAYLTVNVEEAPNPGNDNDVGLCVGSTAPIDLYDALGPDYEFNGDWEDVDLTGVDLSDPNQVDFSGVGIGSWIFTYTLTSNNSCPDQLATITITIYAEPDAGSDNSIDICNTGESRVDLELALGPHDNIGFWTDDDDSGVQLTPASDVDFSGIDTGYYHFTYTIPESDNCPEVSSTITVHVQSAPYAGADAQLSYCQGENDTIDLFALITDEESKDGFWSQLSGDPIDLLDPTQVILNNGTVGTDTLLYELYNDCGVDSAYVLIEISSGAFAGDDYQISVCQNADAVNLFDSLGSYDAGGNWLDENLDIIDRPDSLVFTLVDTLSYQYVVEGAGECASDTAWASIQIIGESFAGGDSSLFICAGTNAVFNFYNLIPEMSDSTGTWTQHSGDPIDLSKPDSVDLSTAVIGLDSIYYIINGICNVDSALLIIQVDDAPYAGDDYTLTICENQGNINLFDSLMNYTAGGNWFDTEGDPVADPEDFSQAETGTYTYYYILPESGSCAADTAIAVITVDQAPYAGEDAATTVCEGSSTSLNLLDVLDSIPDNNGTWMDMDGSGLDLDMWDNLDFSSIGIGNYRFAYIVGIGTTVCEPDTGIVTITIVEFPNAGTSNDFEACFSPTLFINMDSLLMDHDPGGEWSDLDLTGVYLDDPTHVDFSGIAPGAYAFSYFIPAGNGCPPALATITVNILEQADAGNDIFHRFCENYPDPINLYESLDASVDQSGEWVDAFASGLDLSDPFNVDISALSPGIHILEYHLSLNALCGTDTAQLTLEIDDLAFPGACDTVYICNGPSAGTVDFLFELEGEDQGGFFRELTSSGVDISDPTNVNFEGVLDGRYIFEYYFPADNACPEVSTRIYVEVLKSNGLLIEGLFCPDDSRIINGTVYNLDNPSGTEYMVNQYGCDSIVSISIGPKEIAFDAEHLDANCFDFGEISIEEVTGTALPVWISNDDLGLIQISELPLILEDLPAGTYDINMQNEKSCSYDSSIVVAPFEGFLFELPTEVTIQSGQSYAIDLLTDMDPVSIEWFPANGLDCTDCLNPNASPLSDTEYTVTLIDADGCILNGSILIRVEADYQVYLPNAFSPNGDEHNAYFYAKSNDNEGVYNMSIFNRWGELIFHSENNVVNDSEGGWDGRYKDKFLQPGVYVYMIEVTLSNGDPLILSGDVTLLR